MVERPQGRELGNCRFGEASAVCKASSATSKCAFSKTGLIVSKKRQRLTADHVDGISLKGWHYKGYGLGELKKRPRCWAEMETNRR